MEITNKVRCNDTIKYYIQDGFFADYTTFAQGIVVLLQCEQPSFVSLEIDGKKAEEEEMVKNPSGFYKAMAQSTSMQYTGKLNEKEIQILCDREHPDRFYFIGEPVEFIEEWKGAIRTVFPRSEEGELLQIGINFAYGKMNVNQKFLLGKGLTYTDFMNSFLHDEILNDTDGNITLKRPAHMLKNDWVISLHFQHGVLQVVHARLIVAGETEALYTDLNDEQRSTGFDYVCSLFDSYVKGQGQIQEIDGMKLYVKEKTNVLVFKDDIKKCVGLTMFF